MDVLVAWLDEVMGETSDGKNGNRNTKNGKNNSDAFSSLFQHSPSNEYFY